MAAAWRGEYMTSSARSQKYTGLCNQGATCYMNSLLQSLYMSPEFRKKIYSWTYDEKKHGDKSSCIPFQLQVLFGKLQISGLPYIDTKALTKSFGWDLREGFQQHDVQEFCRVLFDAVEESIKGTPEENLINTLYEGILTDYVKCLNCKNLSKRHDTFLDLSLTVRNEFDKIYNDSVETALRNYTKPDNLTGDNKYFCSHCDSKQDALKGLSIERFPYVLVLQLKRFDLDYNTMQRIKLNDKVTFPQILNANPYIGEWKAPPPKPAQEEEEKDDEETKENDQISYFKPPENIDNLELKQTKNSNPEYIKDDRDKKPMQMDKMVKDRIINHQTEERKRIQREEIEKYYVEGEYVYELFSIMIHSGSAMGGHYYAYIKSFEDSMWHNFNDSTVTEIEEKDIKKVFGGETSTKSWSSNYSANAYLLMYRKVSPENIIKIEDYEVPSYIRDELVSLKNKETVEAAQKEEKYKTWTIKVYHKKKEITLQIKKDSVFGEIKEEAIKQFGITDFLPENIRIRGYSMYYDIYQEVYDESKTIEQQQIWNYKVMAVETKNPGDEWLQYDPNKITVRVSLWSPGMADETKSLDEKTSNPNKIMVDKKETVSHLLSLLEEKFGIPVQNQCIVKKSYMGMTTKPEFVNSPQNINNSLSYAKIYEGSAIYLENCENITHSKWAEQIELESKRYTIKFNHPDDQPNAINQMDYSYSVVIDCNSTMKQLKDSIGEKLKLPVDGFVMKRGGKHCQEIKDLSLKIIQANLVNNSVIYIERGKPTKANEYRVVFSIATPAKENDGDATLNRFVDVFDIPLDAGTNVFELKQQLCTKLNDMYPSMELQAKRIRLREKNTDRLLRVFRNSDPLRNYAMYEKKNVAIQILEEDEEEVGQNQIIVVVKRWFPATWELSPAKELIIKKNSTLEEFGQILADTYDIPYDNLEVSKNNSTWNFFRTDLKKETFYKTKNMLGSLTQSPWYLTLDGSLFFIKDSTEKIRDLTPEEKKKYEKTSYGSSSYGSGQTWVYKPPKEESVKIKVKKQTLEDGKEPDHDGLEEKNKEEADEAIDMEALI